MTWISAPVVKFKCIGCERIIERQINARRAKQEIEELRDGPGLCCAECAPLTSH